MVRPESEVSRTLEEWARRSRKRELLTTIALVAVAVVMIYLFMPV